MRNGIKREKLHILYLEDDPLDCEGVAAMLREDGIHCELTRVDTRRGFETAVLRGGWDLILSDYALPSYDGVKALAFTRDHAPGLPFIIYSGTLGEESAIKCLTHGADDYVLKHTPRRLPVAVRHALKEAEETARRREAEEELIKSEERFRIVARATNDVVWDWDMDSDEIWWNDNLTKVLGYQPEQARGGIEFWKKHLHPEEREKTLANFGLVVNGQTKIWSGEYRFRRADGSYAYILDRGYALRGGAGRGMRLIGAMMDVSARKEAEEKIQEQAALIEKANDAVLVRDLDDRIIYWNQSAERIYGWTADEALGRNAVELLTEGPPALVREARDQVMSRGDWSGELQHINRRGRLVVVASSWTLLRDSRHQPKSRLVINRDLTEKKQLEAQFLRAQRMESIGALVGGIAHDLNNTLVPVMMGIDFLSEEPLNGEAKHILATMHTAARRGADMVRQVLTFARGNDAKENGVQVNHLLREMERIIKDVFPKSIQSRVKLAADLWPVSGHPTQLHQVLMNLCINARDAMPNGGQLALSADNITLGQAGSTPPPSVPPGRYLLVTVADTGTGMPPEILDNIFQPFFTTKEPGKGTGLGLSTSLSIIKGHGGFMTVKSQPGKGTEFSIYLPAAPETQATRSAPAPRALPTGNGELILIIDDETAICGITKVTLENCGYRAVTATSGAEALARFTEDTGAIKLAISDMSMPYMDGRAICQALRNMSPRLKIIVASASDPRRDGHSFPVNIEAFIQKPFTAETLVRTVHSVLKG